MCYKAPASPWTCHAGRARRLSRHLLAGAVLRVRHLFHPFDVFSAERFRNRDMGHRAMRRGTVPVLLLRREPDDITGADLLDRPAFALRAAQSRGDKQRLANGCVCQAVRAPGSKVTVAPPTRAPALPLNGASILTVPVKYASFPLAEGCEPLRLISMLSLHLVWAGERAVLP